MKFRLADFMARFPNPDSCLDHIFSLKYPDARGYRRIKTRTAYVNYKGHQIHPLASTIFEKSRTPLNIWFYVIYLFSISKNGVAAKEIQRHLGVTYKTAWRMNHQIRKLMKQDQKRLFGIVEADETYIGGRRRSTCRFKNKTPVVGIVQRGGQVRVKAIKKRDEYHLLPFLDESIHRGTTLYTDEAPIYNIPRKYKRGAVRHSDHEYVRGDVHTNTIEGFWGQMKRSFHGTYHSVSKQHLQSYIDEFAFRYNYRTASSFDELIKRI